MRENLGKKKLISSGVNWKRKTVNGDSSLKEVENSIRERIKFFECKFIVKYIRYSGKSWKFCFNFMFS